MKGYKHLNREQRYTIAQMYKQGASLRTIVHVPHFSATASSKNSEELFLRCVEDTYTALRVKQYRSGCEAILL